ncbi:MAG: type I DNA topoisomerase [Planctomycetota bacterium]|jgi:DNA topoisomerase-1
MTKRLVIVESPTKAKTLKKFLGPDYIVESSVGHIRDLPTSAADIPEKLKKEKWTRLGVNIEADFEPLYVVHPDKKKKIKELKALLKGVDELLLATDEDREGEAISWHLLEVLKPKVPVHRMVFHEITRGAIMEALDHTRELDKNLVSAQEARRIIDRLYGYEVSPILWRKIAPRLSAGRVQSVAVRLVVEREIERMRFREAKYWDLEATFETAKGETFPARLHSLDGQRLIAGKDFDPDTGKPLESKKDRVWLGDADSDALAGSLKGAQFTVSSAQTKPFTRSPAPPFTTSTLQQEGNRKLRFDAKRTMRAAQRLYENGFITYMRTDSVALSSEALRITREAISHKYGADYLPESPRFYKTKVKNAQEAHEAIRPAGSSIRTVEEVAGALGGDEAKVYELIWKRTMACQMTQARGRRMVLQVTGPAGDRTAVFQANGSVIDFPGFLRAYEEGRDTPREQEVLLPPVAEGDGVKPTELEPVEHATTPPARLTEASLVKALEESGIGRPSTYASIIDTIERREYTFKKGSALVPTWVAFAVVRLMRDHLGDLIDIGFTARMEDRLDAISRGEHDALPYLREFYAGNGNPGLRPLLDQKAEDIDPRTVCSFALENQEEGEEIIVRVGRYGPFLQRGETTAPIPDGTCPDELTVPRAKELLEAGALATEPIGQDPESELPVYVKTGRFGPYVQLGDPDPEDKKKKPKMVSLLKGMTPETIDLATALKLLELPRLLGTDADGNEIRAHIGRYGPYIKRGSDSRSLSADDDLLTVSLERALELLAQEKRRGRGAAAEPLKVFEKVEELDGVDIKLLKGRYGPYVTDGTTNASLPRNMDDPMTLTLAHALELLEARRNASPRKKKAKKKAAKKKKVAKKKAAKKASKKKATKKKA